MSSLYDRLRTGTVPKLLSKYKTGVVETGVTVSTPGSEPWDPPIEVTTWTKIDAVVTGVPERFVDSEKILRDDRMVLAQVDIPPGTRIRIDGNVVTEISRKDILAAGDSVVSKVVVRG